MEKNRSTIGIDLMGYPFNRKYPPEKEKYGTMFHGYKNDVHETFFYDFAVQKYDLRFKYKGKEYYVLSETDHVAVCDENYTVEYETFKDGNDLLEKWKIGGKRVVDIIDECEDVEPV